MGLLCAAVSIPLLLVAPAQGSWGARVSELRRLLLDKQFAELERAIVDAQERFDRGDAREDEPWAILEAFASNDELTGQGLSEWMARSPASYAALAARGLYREGMGWRARGAKPVRETTSDQLRTMDEFHAAAADDCAAALAIKPTLVACHVVLINMAKTHGDLELGRRRYDTARRAVPGSALVMTAYLESLTPGWGGSYAAMEDVLRSLEKDASAQTPAARALQGHVKAVQGWMAGRDQDYVKAVALYTEAIARGGGNAAYYAGRGVNAHRLGRKAEALADYDQAIQMAPRGWPYSEAKLPLILAMRASLRFETKDQSGAEADIREARVLDPSNAQVQKWAMRILSKPARP